MGVRNAVTGCVPCNKRRECLDNLTDFFYVTIDYKGNLVVITDQVTYPTVEVDDEDKQITFHDKDVMDFTKPETKMLYNGIHKITW